MSFFRPDLILLHAPSVYDFRKEPIFFGPISDVVPSTPIFELYPVGFSSLKSFIEEKGLRVQIVNLAYCMLKDEDFDVDVFIQKHRPKIAYGIDFHWLPHAHGSIEVAKICKKIHPSIPVIFGGYSATYFQNELIEYEEVDFVLKGDSTEEPLYQLLCAIKNNDSFSFIPNLTWKDETGSHSNAIEYVPNDLGSSTNNYPSIFRSAIKYLHFNHMTPLLDWWQYPIVAIMSCRGCAFNCAICGGSCFAAQSVYGRRAPSFRPPQMLVQDIEAVSRYTKGPIFIIGDLRQAGDEYAKSVLHELKGKNISNQVVLELFDTAPQWFFEEIGQSLPNFNFEISPESCNERIRQVSGKWYTNQELEGNLRWAFEAGCKKFDIFFIIGLPEQTQEAVMADVDYCRYLLSTFGNSVSPFISPLAPFLDPGSIAFENANDMGYTIFYHSLEDYRNALLQPSWKYTLSYETKWMTREEIVMVTYKSARELNHIKWQCGLIDQETHSTIERRIDAALELLEKIDRMMDIVDYTERKKRLHNLKSCMDAARVSIICEKDEIKWPLLKGIGGFKVRNILKDLIFKQLWSSW